MIYQIREELNMKSLSNATKINGLIITSIVLITLAVNFGINQVVE